MGVASWLYASIYKFTTRGRHELLAKFNVAVHDPSISCRYLSDVDMFAIECPDHHGDGPYLCFQQVFNDYVEQTLGEQGNIKVFQAIESKMENDLGFDLEDYERLLKSMNRVEEEVECLIDISVGEDEEHNNGHAWNPEREDTDVKTVFTDAVLDTVAIDTGCPLKLDLEKRSIIIAGVAYTRAAKKLSNIERNAHRKAVATHTLQAERLDNVHFRLSPLVDQAHNTLLRTLVPASDAFFGILPTMLTCRMFRYDERTGDNITILNKPQPPSMPDRSLLQAWTELSFTDFSNKRWTTQSAHQLSETVDTQDLLSVGAQAATAPPHMGNGTDKAYDPTVIAEFSDIMETSCVSSAPPQRNPESQFVTPPPEVSSQAQVLSPCSRSQPPPTPQSLETKEPATTSWEPEASPALPKPRRKSRFDIPPSAVAPGARHTAPAAVQDPPVLDLLSPDELYTVSEEPFPEAKPSSTAGRTSNEVALFSNDTNPVAGPDSLTPHDPTIATTTSRKGKKGTSAQSYLTTTSLHKNESITKWAENIPFTKGRLEETLSPPMLESPLASQSRLVPPPRFKGEEIPDVGPTSSSEGCDPFTFNPPGSSTSDVLGPRMSDILMATSSKGLLSNQVFSPLPSSRLESPRPEHAHSALSLPFDYSQSSSNRSVATTPVLSAAGNIAKDSQSIARSYRRRLPSGKTTGALELEVPLRYENTRFSPKYEWESKVVKTVPTSSHMVDISEPVFGGPERSDHFPPLGSTISSVPRVRPSSHPYLGANNLIDLDDNEHQRSAPSVRQSDLPSQESPKNAEETYAGVVGIQSKPSNLVPVEDLIDFGCGDFHADPVDPVTTAKAATTPKVVDNPENESHHSRHTSELVQIDTDASPDSLHKAPLPMVSMFQTMTPYYPTTEKTSINDVRPEGLKESEIPSQTALAVINDDDLIAWDDASLSSPCGNMVDTKPATPVYSQGFHSPEVSVQPFAPGDHGTAHAVARYLPALEDKNKEGVDLRERVQDVAEPETRQFFRTMGQQKGKGGKKSAGSKGKIGSHVNTSGLPRLDPLPLRHPQLSAPRVPSPPFIARQVVPAPLLSDTRVQTPKKVKQRVDPAEEHKDEVMRVLEHARSFQGSLEIEIQIGQILIHGVRSGEPKNFTNLTMKREAFEGELVRHLNAGDMQVHFSRRLTTDVSEACHIPVPSSFERNPYNTEVFFEFVYLDSDNKQAKFDISCKSSNVAMIQYPEDVGRVYLHFPKRTWDACFTVVGVKDCRVPTAVQKLVSTIVVSTGEKYTEDGKEEERRSFQVPKVKFRVDTSEIFIKAVYAKRRLHHRSMKHPSFTLEVTEVTQQELKRVVSDKSAWLADSGPPSTMIEKHMLWFEAVIRMAPHPLLTQNLTIQLGDDADWAPKDIISEEALSEIKAITEQLVTRLDGVGFGNKGLRGGMQDLANMQNKKKDKQMQKAGINQPFW